MSSVIFVLFLSSAAVFAGNDEELFLRGNKYYENHEYDNALQSYDMMSKKGRAVLYNMGNCFYQKNEYPHALVYWSRAELGAMPHEYSIIASNKEHVLKKIGTHAEPYLWYKIKHFFDGLIPYCSLLLLQLFFLLCWYVLMYGVHKKQMRWARPGAAVLIFFIMMNALMLGVHYAQRGAQHAIVIKKDVQLFAGPDKGFYALSPIAYAGQVIVKETREGWHKVRYAGNIGWVEADVIQII